MDFNCLYRRPDREADLNYLYHRHQVSLFLSGNAACDRSRAAHSALAAAYLARISEAKRDCREHARPELVA